MSTVPSVRRPLGLALSVAVAAAAALTIAPRPVSAADPVNGHCRVHAGMYSARWEAGQDLEAMADWAGRRVNLGGTFHDVDESDSVATNTDAVLEEVWSARALPFANVNVEASAATIAAGLRDNDIRTWARAVQAWTARGGGRALIIAPLHEMNGSWTPYGADPANFGAAYRRFRSIAIEEGLTSSVARWAFAPNSGSSIGTISDYYPGDGVVDLLAVSAFNFGDQNQNGQWLDVHDVLDVPIQQFREITTAKPYLIAETGSADGTPGRDAWVTELFDYVVADPNIVGAIWFNFDKPDEPDMRVWYGDASGSAAWQTSLNESTTAYRWQLADWFGAGVLPFTAPSHQLRHAGSNRIATSVELSRYAFPTAPVVGIARADSYPDALAGAALARRVDAPILLTTSDRLDPQVAAEVDRLGANVAYILGGSGAISTQVEADLRDAGVSAIVRVRGSNRFDTARQIAGRLADTTHAYITEGANADPNRGWPDAVSISGVSAFTGDPILLVERDRLPAETRRALTDEGITSVTIVGGPGAVGAGVEAELSGMGLAISRLRGDTRYGTSKAVAEHGLERGLQEHHVWYATGRNWPDALTAAPIVARCGGSLLLVDGQGLTGSPESRTFLEENPYWVQTHISGGPGVITPGTAGELAGRTDP